VNRRIAFLLVLLALAACKRAPEPPPQPQPPQQKQSAADDATPIAAPIQDIDGDNLLNVAYGAAVISRTGELNLESSAMHAIDGMSLTTWTSPPAGASQTMVFAFGAPSRVEQLGVTTMQQNQAPEKVRFSASSDGRSWREITTIQPSNRGTKMVEVKPFEARYVRVETIEPKEYYAALASVHAIGREIAPSQRHSFAGCWSINTRRATFVQRGTRITGVITGAKAPTYIDGGIEGAVAKLMWMRGPMRRRSSREADVDARSDVGLRRRHTHAGWQRHQRAHVSRGADLQSGGRGMDRQPLRRSHRNHRAARTG
jgi:hypothetical protein